MFVTRGSQRCSLWFAGLLSVAAMTVLAGCDTQSKPVLRQEGWEAIQAGQWDVADAKLSRAVATFPADWRASQLLSVVRLHQGRALEAQLLLEHALTQNPDGPDTPIILDTLAEALYQQGQKDQLVSFLQRTSQERMGVDDYLRQAKYLGKIGDTDGAIKGYRLACKFAKRDNLTPYIALADYYDSVGHRDRAVNALRYAYYIGPTDPAVTSRLRKWDVAAGPDFAMPPVSGPEF